MFLKLLLSIFNVQESQCRLDRQKTKKASITLQNIIGNKWSKSSREENKRCFHEGTLPTQGNHGEEAMDNIQGQDTEQGKRAHFCGKLYEKRSCHDWGSNKKIVCQYNKA